MRRQHGFTLIEIMIVVAIIAVIAAMAVPNLLRSRIQANEAAAVENLRAITSAEATYHSANYQYTGTWDQLTNPTPPPAFLNDSTSNWTTRKNGYKFALSGSASTYSATADPATTGDGVRHFFTDTSGVIRFNMTGTAGTADSPIG